MGIEKGIEAAKYLFGKCKECGQGYMIYVPHDCHYCGGDVVETRANLQIQERDTNEGVSE